MKCFAIAMSRIRRNLVGFVLLTLMAALMVTASSPVAASPYTEGAKKVLFMRVDFSDKPGDPISVAAAQTLIDTTVNNSYVENSYGKTSLQATVTPTLRMPQTSTYYSTKDANGNDNVIQLLADSRAAALAAGYDTSLYEWDICAFVTIFDFGGLGYIGGKGTWLNGYFGFRETAHELGHNYGLYHANVWKTTDGSIIGAGANDEYNDIFDTMGANFANSTDTHFNSWFKNRLDWLTSSGVTSVTTSGTYRIQAQDTTAATGIRGLKIVKDSSKNYWVELRQKLTSNVWASNGALVHWGFNSNQGSQLLDMTPNSAAGVDDAALLIGKTFDDTAAGIHITPIAKGGASPQWLDVVVKIGAFTGNAAPVVSISPLNPNVVRNSSVSFSATASDADGDTLAYFWDFGDGTFASGATTTKTWAADGTYSVKCTVSDMKGGATTATSTVNVGARIVNLIAPADNQSVSGTFTLRATTNDNAATQRIEFARQPNGSSFTRSPNLAIPDNTTVTDSTSISGSGNITTASVSVNITHTYIGDLLVTLIAPDGTRTILSNRAGGSNDDIVATYNVSTALSGKPITGTWQLEINDNAGGDVGTLNSWGMEFAPWTTIASDTDGPNGNGEWTATWDTSVAPAGTYQVRALSVGTGTSGNVSDINTNITVASSASPTVVTNTADSGAGSLRAAITYANSNAGNDTITFNIPTGDANYSGGVFTIKPTSGLPTLIVSGDGTTIDGTTQTAFSGNTNAAGPEIVINGALAGANAVGLQLAAQNGVVRGVVVNGFAGAGISLVAGAVNNAIESSYIGTNAAGTSGVANGKGISLSGGAASNRIGGAAAGIGNRIAFNGTGVAVTSGSGNTIRSNAIHSNSGLGIDLQMAGEGGNVVTLNDASDADSGPNNGQNFPVINTVSTLDSATTVSGTLHSTANTSFLLEFFSNTTADAAGYGEGQTPVGTQSVTTDGAGNATFSLGGLSGTLFSATATDPAGNTSEFGPTQSVEGSVPSAPNNLTATAISASQINLAWSDNSGNESGFKIERSANGTSGWTEIATVGANVASYSNSGLAASTAYFYRVRSYTSGVGNSAYSNTANATTSASSTNGPPSSLVATAASSSQINLAWNDNSDNESGFKIERSPNGTSSWTQIATAAANVNTYSNTGLTASTTYFYRVRSYVTGVSNSTYSNSANATTSPANPGNPPAAPTGLSATAASSSQINLSWTDNSTNESGFKIERASSSSGPWTQIATVAANVATYSDTGLTASTTYFYRVSAYATGTDDSAYSNTASATTSSTSNGPPSNLVAATASASQINLSWSDNSTNESGFKIERSPNGTSSWTQIATVAANITTYANTGLSASTTYFYRVRSYISGVSNSAYSNSANATTSPSNPGGPPVTPSNLTAVTASSSQINLSWTDNSSNESGFKIERSPTSTGTWTQIATVAANVATYSNPGLTASTTYFYRVRSYITGVGDSPYSNTANATTSAPSGTELIVDNADAGGVLISGAWTASSSTPGFYGSNYLHDGNAGKGAKSVRFTPNIPAVGNYAVYGRWAAGSNRASNVPFDITSNSGTATVTANQRLNGGAWVLLGTYAFNAGTGGNVLIRTTGTNGFVIADAVRFVAVN